MSEELRIPVRDGVKLGADLYRPAGDAACPVLLIRNVANQAWFAAGIVKR